MKLNQHINQNITFIIIKSGVFSYQIPELMICHLLMGHGVEKIKANKK